VNSKVLARKSMFPVNLHFFHASLKCILALQINIMFQYLKMISEISRRMLTPAQYVSVTSGTYSGLLTNA